MARKTVELVTCDLCGKEGAETYALAVVAGRPQAPGRLVDLCKEHSSPIAKLLKQGKRATITVETGRVVRSAPRPTAVRRKIYTAEELDAIEAEEKKGK